MPFPLKRIYLELFILSVIENCKTYQTLVSYINSINFVAKFLGFKTYSEGKIKHLMKLATKLCSQPVCRKSAFSLKLVEKLFLRIEKTGGLNNLSLSEVRTFVMILFCNQHYADFLMSVYYVYRI